MIPNPPTLVSKQLSIQNYVYAEWKHSDDTDASLTRTTHRPRDHHASSLLLHYLKARSHLMTFVVYLVSVSS